MRVRVVNERIVNKTAGRPRGSVGICEFSIVAVGGLTTVQETWLLKWVFLSCYFQYRSCNT